MWTVNPLELGPLYPWAGGAWEVIMWIGSVVLWVGWHLLQISREGANYRDEVAKYGTPEAIRKAIGD